MAVSGQQKQTKEKYRKKNVERNSGDPNLDLKIFLFQRDALHFFFSEMFSEEQQGARSGKKKKTNGTKCGV